MINFLTVVILFSILLSITAFALSLWAAIMVVGLKNSTHQVVWKPVEPTSPVDLFSEHNEEFEEELMENPNKRIKPFKPFENPDLTVKEKDIADLEDPAISSNF